MEQKLLAQTAHINTALQCSAQTTAEPSFSQRHSHRYCHPAAFRQLNTRTLTRLLPSQLRVPQRMNDSLISICLVPFMEARSNTDWNDFRTATPAPAKNCTDTPYTVSASDTCKSISQAKSIAIDRLITANNLDYNCSLLTSGSKLCLGPKCTLHEVVKDETCQSISKGKQYTSVQLISWNP